MGLQIDKPVLIIPVIYVGMSTAQFSIYNTEGEGADIGLLTFDSSMVRYAGDRYLDIELILEDESGPVSGSSLLSRH